ncbi:LANO_0F13894g1_1 [Lachancea nothofagi CBS 11611]|uniref:LANO_0F13894g1_1 n=1 Tax=Lachancea nothofagi CBS 11611 TaxID=1266666 RepID=A0A1G4KBZ4_9SACH|nr:LANO_0F13894g1_1 [Lachancea nothofagi CBS 11611]
MDSNLLSRVEALRQKLDGSSISGSLVRPHLSSRVLINKYKYKTKATRAKRNPFLPVKLQNAGKLYERALDGQKLAFGCQEFANHLKSLVKASRHHLLLWNSEKVNAAVLAAAGWSPMPCNKTSGGPQSLILKCSQCSEVFYLKLDEYLETAELESRFKEILTTAHHTGCSWRRRQSYDLEKNYHLNRGNLYLEFERVSNELRRCQDWDMPQLENIDQDAVRPLARTFDVSIDAIALRSLSLVLKGYTFVNKEIVECSGCFQRAFITTIENSETNCHAKWCKYHDESKLTKMLLKSLSRIDKSSGLGERLESLGVHLHAV